MTMKKRIIYALITAPFVTAIGFCLMLLFMWSRSWLGQSLAELGVCMTIGHYILWKGIVREVFGPELSEGVRRVLCVALPIVDYAVIAFALLSGWSMYLRKRPNPTSEATSKPAAGSEAPQG